MPVMGGSLINAGWRLPCNREFVDKEIYLTMLYCYYLAPYSYPQSDCKLPIIRDALLIRLQ